MMDEFFGTTSIHGFGYIQTSKRNLFKLIWLLIIITGFLFAGMMVDQSLTDWSESPIITTLDSIATPIKNVQFPTVTICNQDYHPYDNWSPIEKLLNNLAFECYIGNSRAFPNCSVTQKLRKDFQDIVNALQTTLRRLVSDEPASFFGPSNDKLMQAVKNGLAHRNFTIGDMRNVISDNFGKQSTFADALQTIVPWKTLPYGSIDEATRLNALRYLTAGEVMLGTDKNMPFGNFLSQFASLSMTSMKESDVLQDAFSCKQLTKLDIALHSYFQTLSHSLGFSSSMNVSLLDIPSMLAHLNGRARGKTIKESYVYTQCQQNAVFFKFDECLMAWEAYIKNPLLQSNHPCHGNISIGVKCCPNWTALLGQDLLPIMRVMRLASQRGKETINFQSIQKLMDGTQKYFTNLIGTGHYTEGTMRDMSSMVIKTFFKGAPTENVFAPVFTTKGLCHAFNAYPVQQLLKASNFKSCLTEAFNDDLDHTDKPAKVMGFGSRSGLEVYLDANNLWKKTNIPTTFAVSFSSYLDYFDAKSFVRVVKPGFKTLIDIQPFEVIATERLKSLHPKDRKCRFSDEADDMSIFSNYSQAACQFECLILQATDVCQCVPWNIPTNLSKPQVCDIYGTYCFFAILDQEERLLTCDCLANCNDIQFNLIEKEVPINPKEYCGEQANGDILVMLKKKAGYNRLIATYDLATQLNVSGHTDYEVRNEFLCTKIMQQDIGIVSVQFTSSKYVRTIMDIKLSFTDKMAVFGGTLSLFTGMSLLSLVEIIYWFTRAGISFLRLFTKLL